MKHALGMALFVLSMTGSGCALMQDGARNAYWTLKKPIEEHREKERNRRWADTAWQQVCKSGAPGKPSEDYALGFKAGFAEFLFRGGDGEPPLMPPLRYRDIRYQNEQGYSAVQDWFAGYRHGSGMARDSGARKWVTGPSSLQAQLEVMEAHDHTVPPDLSMPPMPAPTPLPAPDILPPPQVLPAPHALPKTVIDAQPVNNHKVVDNVPPLPEPVRIRIRKITEAQRPTGVEPNIINGNPDELRLHITGMRNSALRPRIVGISAAPSVD